MPRRYTGALEDAAYRNALAGSAEAEAAAALHSNRSACYAAQSRFTEARADGERAVELRPSWARAHSRVGAALHGSGDLEGALAAYKRAVEVDPSQSAAAEQVKAVGLALRNARLEALIERGAFRKRDEDGGEAGAEAGGEAGAEAGGEAEAGGVVGGRAGTSAQPAPTAPQGESGTSKREKTPEELAYKRQVAEWQGAAKKGDISTLDRCRAASSRPVRTLCARPCYLAYHTLHTRSPRLPSPIAHAALTHRPRCLTHRPLPSPIGRRLLAADPTLLSNRSENTAESLLGNTALHWASANGQLSAAEWLLARDGVEVNGKNHGGGTPLHSAAAHARAAVAATLLDAGADIASKDENGDTPRDAASRRGYRSVEAILDRGSQVAEMRWRDGGSGSVGVGGGGGRSSATRQRPESSQHAKTAGNVSFSDGHLLGPREAVWHYTDAILLHRLERVRVMAETAEAAATEAEAAEAAEAAAAAAAESVLLSNRSAAHAKLGQYHSALDDANAAVALRPSWGKAHGRRGAALLGLGDPRNAEEAYREGLEHEPTSAQLKEGLEEASRRIGEPQEVS